MKPTAALFAVLIAWNLMLTWSFYVQRQDSDMVAGTVHWHGVQIDSLYSQLKSEAKGQRMTAAKQQRDEKALVALINALRDAEQEAQPSPSRYIPDSRGN